MSRILIPVLAAAALGLGGQAVFAAGFLQGHAGHAGVTLLAGAGIALVVIGGCMQK